MNLRQGSPVLRSSGDAPGELKMSGALLKIVEPDLDECRGPRENTEAGEIAFSGGCSLEPIATQPPKQRLTKVESLLSEMQGVTSEEFKCVVSP